VVAGHAIVGSLPAIAVSGGKEQGASVRAHQTTAGDICRCARGIPFQIGGGAAACRTVSPEVLSTCPFYGRFVKKDGKRIALN